LSHSFGQTVPNDFAEPIRNCHNCGANLPLGALACEQCHSLVHSEELIRISERAKGLGAEQPLLAKQEWLKALPLLPQNSTQATWIRDQIHKLELSARTAPPPEQSHSWARKLGPLAPIAIVLAKSKTLLLAIFKLKFIFSLFAFMGVYWALYGAAFGIGFAVLVVVHEMGHYIDIRRRGLPADMPVFLPGLGAFVRWKALGVTRQTRAAVSLAGPFAGFLGAAVCALLWYRTGNGLWAALARTTAGLNILNLTPVWVLDGGQALESLGKSERLVLLLACLVFWLFLGEGIFFLVAAGTVYRLFTKDLPPQPSPSITAYFVGVLACLAAVLWMTPGQGLARP
jgi:Zn-dependent protease